MTCICAAGACHCVCKMSRCAGSNGHNPVHFPFQRNVCRNCEVVMRNVCIWQLWAIHFMHRKAQLMVKFSESLQEDNSSALSSAIYLHVCPEVKEHCQCCFLQKLQVGHSSELHRCIAKTGNRQIRKRLKDKKIQTQGRSCPLQLLARSGQVPVLAQILRKPLISQSLKAFRR